MKFSLQKDRLLLLLLAADLVFILLYIIYLTTNLLTTNLYSLSLDRGYAEFFQYTKELWIAILFVLLGVKQRRGIYFVFSALFLFFLFDDAFEFHETFGAFLADALRLQPALGLRPVDFGELIVSGIFGLLFLAAIAIFYHLADLTARRVALYLFPMLAVLAFFGVLADMLGMLARVEWLFRVFVILEEGGEMLVMSLITWYVYRVDLVSGQIPISGPRFLERWLSPKKP